MLQILNKKLLRESTAEEVSFEWTHHKIYDYFPKLKSYN